MARPRRTRRSRGGFWRTGSGSSRNKTAQHTRFTLKKCVLEIKRQLESKSTEELRKILKEQNHEAWISDALVAIDAILDDRGESEFPCSNCGIRDFEFDRYRQEYICKRCGYITKKAGAESTGLWSFIKDNKLVGSISESKMEEMFDSGGLASETLVWADYLKTWTSASETKTFSGRVFVSLGRPEPTQKLPSIPVNIQNREGG